MRLRRAGAEVYVPGPGWITVDPTNRNVRGRNLVRVAVAPEIWQVKPVSGDLVGPVTPFTASLPASIPYDA